MSLFDELISYSKKDIVPMHMPGHKRQSIDSVLPYAVDITEISGFDNLHERHGILRELADKLAGAKGAAYAFPLVGGSTAGILASVFAMTDPGDRVIISRGCHKSVYRACEIRNLRISYLYPETAPEGFFLSVTPGELEKCLTANPGAKLVVITSPTYEGIISDIKTLSEVSHAHGAKLLVDAAHGAHLGYSDCFPEDALSLGADVSVESLHKTLPALTQTAALYLGKGIDPRPFEGALDIFETSSPSYILTASIDRCLKYIDDREVFTRYSRMLDDFYASAACLEKLGGADFRERDGVFDYDRGKIIISSLRCDKSAPEIPDILRTGFGIETEMTGAYHIVCMTSVCDTPENFARLSEALKSIDRSAGYREVSEPFPDFPEAETVLSLQEAAAARSVYMKLSEAAGKISGQYLWAYPPGIPLLTPGEVITPGILRYIEALQSMGIELHIPGESTPESIRILIR